MRDVGAGRATSWSPTTTPPTAPAQLADELAAADDHVHVLHRLGKEGLGAAYLAGFGWGLEHGYGVLVEMDADGSHQPEQLPRLLDGAEGRRPGPRLALGARAARSSTGRSPARSSPAAAACGPGCCSGVPLRDATGGSAPSARETLRGLGLDDVASAGYCFQVDLAWRALKAGYRVVEVPITFVERELGDSKMSQKIVVEALVRTTLWGGSTGRSSCASRSGPA